MNRRQRGLFFRSRLCGMTLMELSVVMGIAGLVLAAVWVTSGVVNKRTALDRGIEDAWIIANNIRSAYTGQTLSTEITTENFLCAGIYPSSMLTYPLTYACPGVTRRFPANAWGGLIRANLYTTGVFNIDYEFTDTATKNIPACVYYIEHFLPPPNTNVNLKDGDSGPVEVKAALTFDGTTSATGLWGRSLTNITTLLTQAGGCNVVRLSFRL